MPAPRTKTFLIGLVILSVCFALFFPRVISELRVTDSYSEDFIDEPVLAVVEEDLSTEILFTGDVMLGRDVERRNFSTQFANAFSIFDYFNTYAAIVVNLEGPVPNLHVPTPDFGFQFSIREDVLGFLQQAGVTHVGLSNNHTYDHGQDGFTQTVNNALESSLLPFGHPQTLPEDLVAYINTNHGRIALVGMHTLVSTPAQSSVQQLLEKVSQQSDMIVVYVHWGDEYQLNHSVSQQNFAELLVAAGADLIIGHHPHVVQGIEVISGVPVLYSLGNTIFDQYFSEDVQEGLLVTLELSLNARALHLHPITSLGTPTHPRQMEASEREQFLEAVANRSALSLQEQIKSGVITW